MLFKRHRKYKKISLLFFITYLSTYPAILRINGKEPTVTRFTKKLWKTHQQDLLNTFNKIIKKDSPTAKEGQKSYRKYGFSSIYIIERWLA